MASYNRVIMIGNLTRDPELKQIAGGQSVCQLGIASNRQYKNKAGAPVQEVCFVDVEVWGPQADSCKQYLQKGRPVLVDGRLKLNSWKDTDGSPRSKHLIVADKVVFLGSAQANDSVSEEMSDENDFVPSKKASVSAAPKQSNNDMGLNFKDQMPFEDDLPF